MELLEKVEKIREKTGVSYEAAKEALEACGEDILDALVYLESQGKIREPEVRVYTTREEASEELRQANQNYEKSANESFQSQSHRFFKWVKKMLIKGMENMFIVSKNGEDKVTIPVLGLVALLLFVFWVTVPLMIIGLFCGYSYSFKGEIEKSVNINEACNKASEVAENLKKEFKKED